MTKIIPINSSVYKIPFSTVVATVSQL